MAAGPQGPGGLRGSKQAPEQAPWSRASLLRAGSCAPHASAGRARAGFRLETSRARVRRPPCQLVAATDLHGNPRSPPGRCWGRPLPAGSQRRLQGFMRSQRRPVSTPRSRRSALPPSRPPTSSLNAPSGLIGLCPSAREGEWARAGGKATAVMRRERRARVRRPTGIRRIDAAHRTTGPSKARTRRWRDTRAGSWANSSACAEHD